jgi:small subunit ribosomal protein S6
MNQYELALVINGKLTDEVRDEALEKVKALIERFEGKIAKVDDWGKRRLAYEIQKVREGFYYFITFESEAEAPAQIEKRIRIMETVLRFLIVKAED